MNHLAGDLTRISAAQKERGIRHVFLGDGFLDRASLGRDPLKMLPGGAGNRQRVGMVLGLSHLDGLLERPRALPFQSSRVAQERAHDPGGRHGLDGPRRKGVHPDLFRAELQRQVPHGAFQCGLGDAHQAVGSLGTFGGLVGQRDHAAPLLQARLGEAHGLA